MNLIKPTPNFDQPYKYCLGNFRKDIFCNMRSFTYPFADENIEAGDKSIVYETNSWGFRSQEFYENRESITFLGCSGTFGIAMAYNDLWCSIVSDKLNIDHFNLGVPGGNADSMFRVLHEWLPILKSKYVFIAIPPKLSRREIIHSNGYIQRIFPTTEDTNIDIERLLSRYDMKFNYLKNMMGIKQLCLENDSILATINTEEIQSLTDDDWSRDGVHPGVTGHKKGADIFIKRLYKKGIINA